MRAPIGWDLSLLALPSSASLDIVFDAYRTDLLLPAERGFGAALWVNGYRLAMLVASAGALVLAEQIGWKGTYLVLAALMGAGIVTILLSPTLRERVPPRERSRRQWAFLKGTLCSPWYLWTAVLDYPV